MSNEQNQDGNSGASGGAQPVQPKVEVIDGVVTVDGHKYVKESDLIAAKKSLETTMSDQQKAHSDAFDKIRLELSAAQSQVASANAKVKELTDAQQKGAGSADDLAKARQELEEAKASMKNLTDGSATYRRKYLQLAAGISEDKIKDLDASALDGLEKALAILGTRPGSGVGNYATGGSGGSGATLSAMDRARALIAATPQAGVRNAQVQQQ